MERLPPFITNYRPFISNSLSRKTRTLPTYKAWILSMFGKSKNNDYFALRMRFWNMIISVDIVQTLLIKD